MNPSFLIPAAISVVVLLVSCETQRTVVGEETKKDPILDRFTSNYQLVEDETGGMRVASEERSHLEGKTWKNRQGEFGSREFRTSTNRDAAKEFRTHEAKGYGDYATGPAREATRVSRFGGAAREAGETYETRTLPSLAAREQGSEFATGEAREARTGAYRGAPVDVIVGGRAGSAGDPSIKEVRELLGKD